MVVYILSICPVTPVSSAIAIAPTAEQKYEIVRVEALPRPTTDRAITWDVVTLLTLQRQSRRLALTDDLIKSACTGGMLRPVFVARRRND
jgi:hypothetical protein